MFTYCYQLRLLIIIAISYSILVGPRISDFSVSDASLMHRYIPEPLTAVPIWLLIIEAFILPTIIIILSGLLSNNIPLVRKLWDIHCGLLAIAGATAFQLTIVCIIKNLSAVPRPDMLSRCRPTTYIRDLNNGDLNTIAVCTTPFIDILREGFRSFPSGHTSTVFTSCTIQFLFVAAKSNVFDGRGLCLKNLTAILLPMITCSYVSYSRVSDNRHFVQDIVAGSFVVLIYQEDSGLDTFFVLLVDSGNYQKVQLQRRNSSMKDAVAMIMVIVEAMVSVIIQIVKVVLNVNI
ncbi:unnamed protein product [[Candida] boidinii]|nr:unnamed protein product [[Candida] boidinii]